MPPTELVLLLKQADWRPYGLPSFLEEPTRGS
jgi:hypothetical protein